MSELTAPNLGLSYGWTAGESGWGSPMSVNLKALDALIGISVIDRDLTTPPGGESDGDRYIVKATGGGGWAGEDGKLAVRVAGAWEFYTIPQGMRVHVQDEDRVFIKGGTDHDLRPVLDVVSSNANVEGVLSSIVSNMYDILLDDALGANWEPTFVFGSGEDARMRIIITQNGTGAKGVNLPGGVLWNGGVAWTMSVGLNAIDIIDLWSPDGGTTVYGLIIGQAFA